MSPLRVTCPDCGAGLQSTSLREHQKRLICRIGSLAKEMAREGKARVLGDTVALHSLDIPVELITMTHPGFGEFYTYWARTWAVKLNLFGLTEAERHVILHHGRDSESYQSILLSALTLTGGPGLVQTALSLPPCCSRGKRFITIRRNRGLIP